MFLSLILGLMIFSTFVSAFDYPKPSWRQQDYDFQYKYSNYNPSYSQVEKTTNYYTLTTDYSNLNGYNNERIREVISVVNRNIDGYGSVTYKTTRTTSLAKEDIHYYDDYGYYSSSMRRPYRYLDYGVEGYDRPYYYQPRYDRMNGYYVWD